LIDVRGPAVARTGASGTLTYIADMAVTPRPSVVDELRERVEYLEDSLAAFESRAERDEKALRPWNEIRQ
jgi:hypothetical protein